MTPHAGQTLARVPPLKVLHYSPLDYGMTGVESFVLQLTAGQKRLGLDPVITIPISDRQELVRTAAAAGVPVADFPARVSLGLGKLNTLINSVRRVRHLVRLLQGCTALHMHSAGFVGLEAMLAAYLVGTPKIVVTHHATVSSAKPFGGRMASLTRRVQARLATASVMPYEDAAQELAQEGLPAERVKAVPYCIDEVRFAGENVPPEPDEPMRLIMVARLFPGKGHEVLLNALALLKQRGCRVSVVMVGHGDQRPLLQKQIQDLDIADMAELREHVNHSEIPAMLQASHAIVLPSFMRGETFPLSLLEGQLVGLPAIATRWYGIPSIVEDGKTGFLVEPRSEESLADAIQRLDRDRVLYAQMRSAARMRARERYTAQAVARTYAQLYGLSLAAGA